MKLIDPDKLRIRMADLGPEYERDVMQAIRPERTREGWYIMEDADFIRIRRKWQPQHTDTKTVRNGRVIPGVGDHLHRLITEHFGVEPCKKCDSMIKEMNRAGADAVRENVDDYAERIWQRRTQLKGWQRIAAQMPGAKRPALRLLKRLILKACDETA